MARPIGEPKPPEAHQVQEKTSDFFLVRWLGRLIKWIFPTKVENTHLFTSIEKTHETAVSHLETENELPTFHKQQLQERFEHNYGVILGLSAKDMPYLKVVNGKITKQTNASSQTEQDQVRALFRQTHRQAWGKLIDAKYGLAIQEEHLQRLNKLNAHLAQEFPSLLTKDREKPLVILSNKFGKEPAQPMPRKLMQEHQKVIANSKRAVTQLAQGRLETQALGELQTGVNPTEFVTSKATDAKLAVRKSEQDVIVSALTAYEVNKEIGKEKLDASLTLSPSQLGFLSGFHESLASHLNIILNGRLGIPVAAQGELISVHAFVENKGNYYDFIEENEVRFTNREDALQLLPIDSSQHFVFAQLITRNSDCHGGNILISSTNDPVPIDFGRILSDAPLRAAYLGFPCLDKPINEEDKIFFQQLDVEKTMDVLQKTLQAQYPKQFADPKVRRVLLKKLEMLKARLYMVKMGVAAGLNQRQLVALDLPPISASDEQFFNDLLIMNSRSLDSLRNAGDKKGLFNLLRNIFLRSVPISSGFGPVWSRAYDPSACKLDVERFQALIQKEIDFIRGLPEAKLYTAREIRIYDAGGIDAGWEKDHVRLR